MIQKMEQILKVFYCHMIGSGWASKAIVGLMRNLVLTSRCIEKVFLIKGLCFIWRFRQAVRVD